jgi:hypothetical protein
LKSCHFAPEGSKEELEHHAFWNQIDWVNSAGYLRVRLCFESLIGFH